MPPRRIATLLLPALLALGGCGGDDKPSGSKARSGALSVPSRLTTAAQGTAGLPPAFAAQWNRTAGDVVGVERDESAGPGNQTAHLVRVLQTTKGTVGYLYITAREKRTVGDVKCGATAYSARVVSNQTSAGSGWFGVQNGGGTARLHVSRAIVVAADLEGKAICASYSGTWTGTDGALADRHGTFTFAEGVLTLR